MPARLILARHGETTANLERRIAGHFDVALTALGRRQARALGRRLRDAPIAVAYASDLSRARDTAEIALRGRDVDIRIEPRLREFWFGEWEQLMFEEVQAKWPDQVARLFAMDASFCAPGGEPLGVTCSRVVDAMTEIVAAHPEETVLVAAHAGTIQIALAHALGMPVENLFRLRLGNCGVSEIEFHGERPLVTLINDCRHTLPRPPRLARTESGT